VNGYKIAGEGELFLENQNYAISDPVLPDAKADVQIQIEQSQGNLPNITVKIAHNGNEIGSCIALSGGDFVKDPGAQELIFIDGLGITKSNQGQGWGRYLLSRTLWEARQLGYKHTVISTSKRNYRAQLFYANYGYGVTDTVFGFQKILKPIL
jgi:ribosomal protein S18 acetylase RimI-like enzyme